MTTQYRVPVQIPLPLIDKPKGKLDLSRQAELIAVLAELVLLAARPAPALPGQRSEVRDEAR